MGASWKPIPDAMVAVEAGSRASLWNSLIAPCLFGVCGPLIGVVVMAFVQAGSSGAVFSPFIFLVFLGAYYLVGMHSFAAGIVYALFSAGIAHLFALKKIPTPWAAAIGAVSGSAVTAIQPLGLSGSLLDISSAANEVLAPSGVAGFGCALLCAKFFPVGIETRPSLAGKRKT